MNISVSRRFIASQEEMDDCLVIVFIAETDAENVYQISSEIQSQFNKHLESGST
jgi:hypothetical protein